MLAQESYIKETKYKARSKNKSGESRSEYAPRPYFMNKTHFTPTPLYAHNRKLNKYQIFFKNKCNEKIKN